MHLHCYHHSSCLFGRDVVIASESLLLQPLAQVRLCSHIPLLSQLLPPHKSTLSHTHIRNMSGRELTLYPGHSYSIVIQLNPDMGIGRRIHRNIQGRRYPRADQEIHPRC
jgi:hypothetical protein